VGLGSIDVICWLVVILTFVLVLFQRLMSTQEMNCGNMSSEIGLEIILGLRFSQNSAFRDIIPRSKAKFNQHFGGKYHLYLQGRRVSHSNERETGSKPSAVCLWYPHGL
jgi:hypothetical protein